MLLIHAWIISTPSLWTSLRFNSGIITPGSKDRILKSMIDCSACPGTILYFRSPEPRPAATGGFKIPSAVGSVSSSSRYSPDVSAGPPLR